MQLYSTKNSDYKVGLKEAVMKGLPPDNGLFMPVSFPKLSASFIKNLATYSFQEIAFEVCKQLFQQYIPENDLQTIIENTITFPAPVVKLDEHFSILELFHGPSLAFKDFGARFMAQLMSYFNRGNDKELVILVATSGDTGAAVAAGFHNTPGIKVVVLYPKGRVSHLQEKQLTTLGGNITTLRVDGSFDDCQHMVKSAFLDTELNNSIRLTSANSINIARLIPQSFYYFEGFKQVQQTKPIAFCVPSGNFGNLTAGLFAKQMGLPIDYFIAATNSNKVVPDYISTGIYEPTTSVSTISNAMDVGNPSNFARMLNLYDPINNDSSKRSTWNNFKNNILTGFASEQETEDSIKEVFNKYNYIIDPHGAVGYHVSKTFVEKLAVHSVILETAHPSKFLPTMQLAIPNNIEIPERLQILAHKESIYTDINTEYNTFKTFLEATY